MAKIEINQKELNALRECVDYLYEIEETHFKECDQTEKKEHIFNKVRIVRAWINNQVIKSYNQEIENKKIEEINKRFDEEFKKGFGKNFKEFNFDNFEKEIYNIVNNSENKKLKTYYSDDKPKTKEQKQADKNLSDIAKVKRGKKR